MISSQAWTLSRMVVTVIMMVARVIGMALAIMGLVKMVLKKTNEHRLSLV